MNLEDLVDQGVNVFTKQTLPNANLQIIPPIT